MPKKIYRVKLTNEERLELKEIISKGKAAAHKQTHARILLLSDEASSNGNKKDKEIVNVLDTSLRSVERVRKRFVEEGLDSAINPKPQKRYRSKKLDGVGEAFLVATACSKAPEGQADWTLRLFAEQLIECNIIDSISHETIRQTLKKTNLNLG
jgi:transposase